MHYLELPLQFTFKFILYFTIKSLSIQFSELVSKLTRNCIVFKVSLFLFKLEVTKFDELEEVHSELKLKELLWYSLDDWDALYNKWVATKFDEIDIDEMTTQVY